MCKTNIPDKLVINEYLSRVNDLHKAYNDMNDISLSVKDVYIKQKKFEELEESLKSDLFGKHLPYIYIDSKGSHSFKERKVSNGKWENYKDYLISLCDYRI